MDTTHPALGFEFRGEFGYGDGDGLGEYRDYDEEGGETEQHAVLLSGEEDAHR